MSDSDFNQLVKEVTDLVDKMAELSYTTAEEILEKKCFKEIIDVPHDIDIVDVFRPSEQGLPIIKDAIKKNPKVIWLQEGIHNEEAEQLARDSGIDVVFNRCMLAEHQRLM